MDSAPVALVCALSAIDASSAFCAASSAAAAPAARALASAKETTPRRAPGSSSGRSRFSWMRTFAWSPVSRRHHETTRSRRRPSSGPLSSAETAWEWPLASEKVVEGGGEEEGVESSSSPFPPASAHATSSIYVSRAVVRGARTSGADQQRSQSVARTKSEEVAAAAAAAAVAVAVATPPTTPLPTTSTPPMPSPLLAAAPASRSRVTTTNRPSGNTLLSTHTCATVQSIVE